MSNSLWGFILPFILSFPVLLPVLMFKGTVGIFIICSHVLAYICSIACYRFVLSYIR